MLPTLLFTAAFYLGQAPAATEPPPQPPSPPPDRWFVMRELQGTSTGALLYDGRINVSGWTDASFTASTDAHSNLPLGFNYLANQFLLQQNWLRFERPVITSGTSQPTFGFRFDTILPGSDYRFTLARGVFDSQLTADHGQPATYGIDPIQFYLEAYFPTIGRGLDIKFGRIFCQYGVESNEAVSNALASHNYSFIYDPFTHTGVMGTLKLTDAWSVQVGAMLGSDIFIDPADTPTGMASVKWAPTTSRDSVLFSVIIGNGRFNQERQFHNPEIFDLVWTHKINARLNYSFEGLYGFTTNVPDIGFANWLGILNYLTRTFTPRLDGTVRLEFFDDVQGDRTGFPGLYTAITAGLAFKPRRLASGAGEVLFRPEIRYDYNNESRPFEDHHGLFTATSDVIVRW
jgi:hypothetical protein